MQCRAVGGRVTDAESDRGGPPERRTVEENWRGVVLIGGALEEEEGFHSSLQMINRKQLSEVV